MAQRAVSGRRTAAWLLKKSPDPLRIRRFGLLFIYFFGEGAGLAASFFPPLPAFTSMSVADIV